MNRRTALSFFVKGLGATMAGVMAIPLALHSLSPLFRRPEERLWESLGPFDEFPLNKIVPAKVQVAKDAGSMNFKSVYVWRKSQQDFVVYSKSCTDLGCPLKFDPGSEWFFCPCHGGIFDKEGERRAGPPKKPMWRYMVRIKNGILEIDLKSVPPMA